MLHVKYSDKLDVKEQKYKAELEKKVKLLKTEQEKIIQLNDKIKKLEHVRIVAEK